MVLEGLDGRLSLQHEGRIIASQEAPPSPASLRRRNETSPATTIPPSRQNLRLQVSICRAQSQVKMKMLTLRQLTIRT